MNIPKNLFLIMIVAIFFLAGVFTVYAYNSAPAVPSNFGHSASEIDGITVDGSSKNLQGAIDTLNDKIKAIPPQSSSGSDSSSSGSDSYYVEVSAAQNEQKVFSLDMTKVNELCGDAEGCSIRIIGEVTQDLPQYKNRKQIHGSYAFIKSSDWMMITDDPYPNPLLASKDGDGTINLFVAWLDNLDNSPNCIFSDGDGNGAFVSGKPGTADSSSGIALHADAYNTFPVKCGLFIED